MLFAARQAECCVISSLSAGFHISGKLSPNDVPAFAQNYGTLRDNMNCSAMKLVSLSYGVDKIRGKKSWHFRPPRPLMTDHLT